MSTDTSRKPNWRALLNTAVSEPGVLNSAYSQFWNYSVGNQLLALLQCWARSVEPGPLASFCRWKALGRHVKKGEKAIELCMPVTLRAKEADDEPQTIFIMRRNWFVLSQTDGPPYVPDPVPEWDQQRALETLEIRKERFGDLNGNVQGYAMAEGRIAVSPLAALPHKTLFHEMAHVLLGHTDTGGQTDESQPTRCLQEVEAEAVALVCCESLGLGGAEFCRGYIQHWLADEVIPEHSARRIFAVADRILKAGARAMQNGDGSQRIEPGQ